MTNADKYKEVFGVSPDMGRCITDKCQECPLSDTYCTNDARKNWWASEYQVRTDAQSS